MSLWITPCLWRTDNAFRTDRHTVAICSSFILKMDQDKTKTWVIDFLHVSICRCIAILVWMVHRTRVSQSKNTTIPARPRLCYCMVTLPPNEREECWQDYSGQFIGKTFEMMNGSSSNFTYKIILKYCVYEI